VDFDEPFNRRRMPVLFLVLIPLCVPGFALIIFLNFLIDNYPWVVPLYAAALGGYFWFLRRFSGW